MSWILSLEIQKYRVLSIEKKNSTELKNAITDFTIIPTG